MKPRCLNVIQIKDNVLLTLVNMPVKYGYSDVTPGFIEWLYNDSMFKHASGFHGNNIIVKGICCEDPMGKEAYT